MFQIKFTRSFISKFYFFISKNISYCRPNIQNVISTLIVFYTGFPKKYLSYSLGTSLIQFLINHQDYTLIYAPRIAVWLNCLPLCPSFMFTFVDSCNSLTKRFRAHLYINFFHHSHCWNLPYNSFSFFAKHLVPGRMNFFIIGNKLANRHFSSKIFSLNHIHIDFNSITLH